MHIHLEKQCISLKKDIIRKLFEIPCRHDGGDEKVATDNISQYLIYRNKNNTSY